MRTLPIDTSKPGRRYVRALGLFYTVYAHPFGCLEIEDRDTGATAFFQGDDATTLDLELDSPVTVDNVCGEYVSLLTDEA